MWFEGAYLPFCDNRCDLQRGGPRQVCEITQAFLFTQLPPLCIQCQQVQDTFALADEAGGLSTYSQNLEDAWMAVVDRKLFAEQEVECSEGEIHVNRILSDKHSTTWKVSKGAASHSVARAGLGRAADPACQWAAELFRDSAERGATPVGGRADGRGDSRSGGRSCGALCPLLPCPGLWATNSVPATGAEARAVLDSARAGVAAAGVANAAVKAAADAERARRADNLVASVAAVLAMRDMQKFTGARLVIGRSSPPDLAARVASAAESRTYGDSPIEVRDDEGGGLHWFSQGQEGGLYPDSVSEHFETGVHPFQLWDLEMLNLVRYENESDDEDIIGLANKELEHRRGVGL